MFEKVMSNAGVKPEYDGKLLLRKRKAADKEAWVFTNNADKDVVEKVCVKGWKKAEDLIEGPLAIQADLIKLAGDSYSVPLGQALLQWLDSHTHTTGVGPSGPPITPTTPHASVQEGEAVLM